MATGQDRLSTNQVLGAKPKSATYDLADAGGLYLSVARSGAKWWRFRYRSHGLAGTLALGAFPAVSLADARRARDVARYGLTQGVDPKKAAADRIAAERQAAGMTLNVAARAWLLFMAGRWSARQVNLETRCLERHVFPWLGATPMAHVTSPDVRRVLERLLTCGSINQAHRVRRTLTSIFAFASCEGHVTRNPALGMQRILPQQVRSQFCALSTPEEVTALLHAFDRFNGQFVTLCALRLSALVFLRPKELRNAEWREIDLVKREWTLPAARMKMYRISKRPLDCASHIVPLSRQAVELLGSLRPLTGGGRFVFPGVLNPQHPMAAATLNSALRRLGYDRDSMTPHGFRHMASTLLNELGWHPDAIERQLSHRAQGVRAIYNRAAHLPERRDMMQAWADYLDALHTGPALYAKPLQVPAAVGAGNSTKTDVTFLHHSTSSATYGVVIITMTTTHT